METTKNVVIIALSLCCIFLAGLSYTLHSEKYEELERKIAGVNSGLSLIEGHFRAIKEQFEEQRTWRNMFREDLSRLEGEMNLAKLFIQKYKFEELELRFAKIGEMASAAYYKVDSLFKDAELNRLDNRYVTHQILKSETDYLTRMIKTKGEAIDEIKSRVGAVEGRVTQLEKVKIGEVQPKQ